MSDIEVTLLGGVLVRDQTGAAIDIGPAKCQAVLAALAVESGSSVSVSSIVERVWGSQPPRTAEKTLQSYIAQLRRALGAEIVTRVGVAYRLELPAAQTDIGRFRGFVAAGDYRAALQEWGGAPFEGLDFEGLMPLVAALTEEWFAAIEADLDSRVGSSPQTTLVSLTELTLRYPLRERLWALLMTALYGVGRQADALRAFQDARTVLVDELGIEPGPELRELEAAILAQSLSLGNVSGRVDVPRGTVTFAFIVGALDAVADVASDSRPHPFRSAPRVQGLAFHRASEAVAWSLATQQRAHDVGVGLQVGIHSGEPELTRHGYFGPAVTIASQLATVAAPGSTLATAVTADLAGSTEGVDLGLRSLEGAVGQQRVVRLGGAPVPKGDQWSVIGGNLPLRPRQLIGRSHEISAIADLVGTRAITTLVGSGGIGKTSLALAVAHTERSRSSRTCWYIELAAIRAEAEVPAAIARVLGATGSGGSTVTDSIVSMLQTSSDLLLIDNCEHVLAGAAAMVNEIARRCPSVSILVTSREGLGVGGEQIVVVSPLVPETEGVRLFVQRASEATLTFDPSANAEAVSEICRRLEGVPLAIELAAARVRTLTPVEILSRLEDLTLLAGSRRSGDDRHRTLRAAITWSYDLLSRAEQDLLALMSVFVGSFDLDAAATVAADDALDQGHVDELLARLVERSVLLVEPGSLSRRFRLLETMRQFGSEMLREHGDPMAAGRRHAEWCRGQIAEIAADLQGVCEVKGVARLDELWSNLRAAVEWSLENGHHTLTWELIGPIGPEVALRHRSELGRWFERLLEARPDVGDDVTAFSLYFVALWRMMSLAPEGYEALVAHLGNEPDHPVARLARALLYDDDDAILEHAGSAAAEARVTGNPVVAKMAAVARLSAHVSRRISVDLVASDAHFLDELRRDGPPTLYQWTLFHHGLVAENRGERSEAAVFFDEASRIEVAVGTLSIGPSVDVRRATHAGHAGDAISILQLHLADLIDSETVGIARVVAVSFVDLLDSLGRHDEAEPVRRFLHTAAGDFGAQAARTFLDQPANSVPDGAGSSDDDLDSRSAIAYMASALERVASGVDS